MRQIVMRRNSQRTGTSACSTHSCTYRPASYLYQSLLDLQRRIKLRNRIGNVGNGCLTCARTQCARHVTCQRANQGVQCYPR